MTTPEWRSVAEVKSLHARAVEIIGTPDDPNSHSADGIIPTLMQAGFVEGSEGSYCLSAAGWTVVPVLLAFIALDADEIAAHIPDTVPAVDWGVAAHWAMLRGIMEYLTLVESDE